MPSMPSNDAPYRLLSDVDFGPGVIVYSFTNLYGCKIGAETRIGPYVEIQAGAVIGERCKIQSHTLICEGVVIGDGVFVGHGVMFINDKRPTATNDRGELVRPTDLNLERTAVEHGATIGSNATILGGITIGAEALVGAGAVVTHEVPPGAVVAGVPATELARR
jgi:UDP-2-acetamido-3-amino-2,3-dideoxy-glucuronate N-acetyltransferase